VRKHNSQIGTLCVTIGSVKEPSTSAEYNRFKSLLNKVMSVPHDEIMRREAEYQKTAALNPNRRGPKPRKRVSRAPVV